MIEQILASLVLEGMLVTTIYVLIWGHYFDKETKRMWQEYVARKDRIDKIQDKGAWIPKKTGFNPDARISNKRGGK